MPVIVELSDQEGKVCTVEPRVERQKFLFWTLPSRRRVELTTVDKGGRKHCLTIISPGADDEGERRGRDYQKKGIVGTISGRIGQAKSQTPIILEYGGGDRLPRPLEIGAGTEIVLPQVQISNLTGRVREGWRLVDIIAQPLTFTLRIRGVAPEKTHGR